MPIIREPDGQTDRKPKRSEISASMSPTKKDAFGYEQARHLLWRAGFGGTPQQVQTLVEWGPERSVDYLLDVDKVPFEEVKPDQFNKDIMRPPTPEEQRMAAQARRGQDENALA